MSRRDGALAALAGAAGAAAALALRRYNATQVRRAERRFPPDGEFLFVRGVRLHYVRRGRGPAVFCFHGAAGSTHDFDAALPLLARHFTVHVFDRPGHGYSQPLPPGADVSVRAQAEFFHDVARALDVERPILVGYSWSAALALAYAEAYPDETGAVVLVGGLTHEGAPPKNPLYWILRTPFVSDALIAFGLVPIGRGYIRVPLARAFAPEPLPADFLDVASAIWVRPESVRSMTEDFHTLERGLDLLRPGYAGLRVPIVALTGDADHLVDYRANTLRFVREAPTAELMVVRKGGHALPHTRPDAVAAAVDRAAELRAGPRPPERPGSATP